MEEAEDKFGSKGKTNAGLTLGIIGTALAGLGGNLGLFGGATTASTCTNADSNGCAFVNKDTFWRQNVELEKELGVQRYDNLKANYDLYITLDNKISALATNQATVNAQLPLMFQLANMTSERYTDDKCCKSKTEQSAYNFMFQRELDKKINGTIGLPWSDIISGIPQMPAYTMSVSCPTTSAA